VPLSGAEHLGQRSPQPDLDSGVLCGGRRGRVPRATFVVESDEPPLVLGKNHGANAVEIALAALASCLTGTLAYYGAAMGIELEEVSAELEGVMDMRGMLGVDESTRNGLQHIRVGYRIKSPEPRERVLELLGVAQKASPLYDIMTNPVPVSLSLLA
jgi:uncharacterized OsmC-like protein